MSGSDDIFGPDQPIPKRCLICSEDATRINLVCSFPGRGHALAVRAFFGNQFRPAPGRRHLLIGFCKKHARQRFVSAVALGLTGQFVSLASAIVALIAIKRDVPLSITITGLSIGLLIGLALLALSVRTLVLLRLPDQLQSDERPAACPASDSYLTKIFPPRRR